MKTCNLPTFLFLVCYFNESCCDHLPLEIAFPGVETTLIGGFSKNTPNEKFRKTSETKIHVCNVTKKYKA